MLKASVHFFFSEQPRLSSVFLLATWFTFQDFPFIVLLGTDLHMVNESGTDAQQTTVLLFILSGHWLCFSHRIRETDTPLHVFPATSLYFLLTPLLICSVLVVRFAPHLICNSSTSSVRECIFPLCIPEERCFETKRRFLIQSLTVHNKRSFLALQEDLHRTLVKRNKKYF